MTRDQYREVQRIAADRGFSSLSDYVRYQVFDRDWTMAIQVGEIHAALIKQRTIRGGGDREDSLVDPK